MCTFSVKLMFTFANRLSLTENMHTEKHREITMELTSKRVFQFLSIKSYHHRAGERVVFLSLSHVFLSYSHPKRLQGEKTCVHHLYNGFPFGAEKSPSKDTIWEALENNKCYH